MGKRDATSRPDEVRLTVLVSGVVQGVGFRYLTARRAEELELTGTATNRNDGSVEIIAEGPQSAAAELLAWLRSEGPPGKVEDVASSISPASGSFRSFHAG
ncbi:acylphosphatase [Arthrobacter sp. A5]|uniref:acylphosphatase n=1 Tax=Arthrobacter sp. A5 TaxID=576926 RepID=UPI003DA9A6C6